MCRINSVNDWYALLWSGEMDQCPVPPVRKGEIPAKRSLKGSCLIFCCFWMAEFVKLTVESRVDS